MASVESAPFLQNEPIAADPREELRPLPLTTACLRVGHIVDLWHTDPRRLLRTLKEGCRVADQHPLRGVFLPGVQLLEAPVRAAAADGPAPKFKPGQSVKVRLGPDVKKSHLSQYSASDCTFADDSKEWDTAKITELTADGDYTIVWEAGYDGHTKHAEADIKPVDDDLGTEGASEYILERDGYRGGVRFADALKLLILAIGTVMLPHVLGKMFARDVCHDDDIGGITQTICGAGTDGFARGDWGGLWIGAASLIICSIITFIVAPGIYSCTHACLPSTAKVMRQTVEKVMLDPLRAFGLPNTYGKIETGILLLFASANLSGIVVSLLTLDGGLVPLTTLVCAKFLALGEAIFGESTGLKQIRRDEIMILLMKHMEKTKVDLTQEMLLRQMDRLLEMPFNAGKAKISVQLLTLLSSAVKIEQPDSVRLRTFIVEGAYAEYKHPIYRIPELKEKHSVLVDVFTNACTVPGRTLVGERWCKEGQPLPWHLAVKAADVVEFEQELQARGLPIGAGSLTWSAKGGNPAALEAKDPSVLLDHSRRLKNEQESLNRALYNLCNSGNVPDDPELVRPFLRRGADVDTTVPPAHLTPLIAASQKGKKETAKLLIGARADVNAKEASGLTPLHKAHNFGCAGLAKLLIEANADVTITNKRGIKPIDMGGPDAARIRKEMTQFMSEYQQNQMERGEADPGARQAAGATAGSGNSP